MDAVIHPGVIKLPHDLMNERHNPELRYKSHLGWWFFCPCGASSRASDIPESAIGRALNHVDLSMRTYAVTFLVNGEALKRVKNTLSAYQRAGVVSTVMTREVEDGR